MRNVWVVVVVCVVAVELLVLHLNWIIIEQARKKDRSFWLENTSKCGELVNKKTLKTNMKTMLLT